MIVEDPESLKSWMSKILEPMCEADPEALAKYIYALVKKDKSVEVIKQGMVGQLEVFLQKDTVPFVELLFERLANQNFTSAASIEKSEERSTTEDLTDISQSLSCSLPLSPLSGVATLATDSLTTSLDDMDIESELNTSLEKSFDLDKELPTNMSSDICDTSALDSSHMTTSTNYSINQERLTSSMTSLSSSDKLNISGSTSSLERQSSHSSQTSKDQAVFAITSALSPEQRNGTLGSILLSAANKRNIETERRSSLSKSRERKSDSEKDDRSSSCRSRHSRRRDSSLSPFRRSDRSRSRSWDRNLQRRSRSRSKDKERIRAWRNKSPPYRRYDRERRKSWSKSPGRRLHSHSRSPPVKPRVSRFRNRSPPIKRSHSKSPYDKNDKLSPLSQVGDTSIQESNHGDTDMRLPSVPQNIPMPANQKDIHFVPKHRCRDFDEKGYCMRGDLCPFDHGNDPVVLEDIVLPPNLAFAQGTNPHVIRPPGLMGQSVAPPIMPTSVIPPRAPMLGLHHRQQGHVRLPHPMVNLEYNPDAPSMEPRMWIRNPFRPQGRGVMHGGLRNMGPEQMQINPNFSLHQQRELINVPVLEGGNYLTINPNKRTHHGDFVEEPSPLKQRQYDYGRAPPHRGNAGNCSLELKKVPGILNNITHLNNHFAKFGKIVNIQVCYEGDFEGALITFSSHAEAAAAYKSTEAVLNNRFIRVFWHTEKEGRQENVPPLRSSISERLGTSQPPQRGDHSMQITAPPQELEKVVMTGNNITKTVYIPTALRKTDAKPTTENKVLINQPHVNISSSSANIIRNQEILAAKDMIRKKREEKMQEAHKLSLHLFKRKQGLLDKSLNQQKSLLDRLEKGNLSQEQRNSVVQTINMLQESIDMMRKDLIKSTVTPNSVVKTGLNAVSQQYRKVNNEVECLDGVRRNTISITVANELSVKGGLSTVSPQMLKKTKEETQKQILDAELDIFNRQQEGKDTGELQKRVVELKARVHHLGLYGQGRSIRGRGGTFRGRGRGIATFTPHSSVDHRPTKLLVSGFEIDDKMDVLTHFTRFGEIQDFSWDDETPALVVTFKTRKEAEAAISKGRNFQDRLLCANWYNPTQQLNIRNNVTRTVQVAEEEEEESVLMEEEQEEEREEDDEELKANMDLHEDFLLQDEEEEEEEDRTWRR